MPHNLTRDAWVKPALPFICFDADHTFSPDAKSRCTFFDWKMALSVEGGKKKAQEWVSKSVNMYFFMTDFCVI